MVVYFILKGPVYYYSPESFHCYDDYCVNNDGVIKWHDEESHQKHKARKASIKNELMRVA